jgi:hypothetical protein
MAGTTGTELERWPLCSRQTHELCELEVDPRRVSAGYSWCFACADPKKKFPSAQMAKSNAVLITDVKQLKYISVQTPRTDAYDE